MEGGYVGVEPSRAVSTSTERAYIWEGSREEGRKGRKEEGRDKNPIHCVQHLSLWHGELINSRMSVCTQGILGVLKMISWRGLVNEATQNMCTTTTLYVHCL